MMMEGQLLFSLLYLMQTRMRILYYETCSKVFHQQQSTSLKLKYFNSNGLALHDVEWNFKDADEEEVKNFVNS